MGLSHFTDNGGRPLHPLTQLIRDYKSGRLAKICQSGPKGESHGHASNNGNKVL
jgi:hypothetical protein